MTYLVYFLEIRDLYSLKDKIFTYFYVFNSADYLFYAGVLYYRLGLVDISKIYNSHLFKYKDELKYFQGGAISYIDFDECNSKKQNEIHIINQLDFAEKGILLISSDYGYFKAYSDKTINSSIDNNNIIHFHLVFPNKESVSLIDIDFFIKNKIGLSYEIKDVGNNPTYYSIARYLVLSRIMSIYNSSVIVCDIDIRLDNNIDYIFDKLGSDKIGLVNSGKDLPWISYLAGFNYFGKNTKNSSFLNELEDIMSSLFYAGHDLWMLDQVALQLAIEKNKDFDLVVNLSEYLLHGIKQYDNRQQARSIARKVTESLHKLALEKRL